MTKKKDSMAAKDVSDTLELALEARGLESVNVKIERGHRSLKNEVLLENYYLPGDLKARIAEFVDYYNIERNHESLDNRTLEDVYTGRNQTVLDRRRRIKLKTIKERRRLYYRQNAA